MINHKGNNLLTGANYFFDGLQMLSRPELRKFILVPLAINTLLCIGLTVLFFSYASGLMDWNLNFPAWLEFLEKTLKVLAWVLIGVFFFIAYAYSFNMITNLFAAPFYGLLAQKTEEILTGVRPEDEPLSKMIPRTIGRELQKLVYFIGRGILVFLLIILLSTLFVLGIFAPVVGAFWGAWSMAIQYVDYPADNHQTQFRRLRKKLRKPLYSSVGFGAIVMVASMIPFVNIVVGPAAVIGGTMFWVRELKTAEISTANS